MEKKGGMKKTGFKGEKKGCPLRSVTYRGGHRSNGTQLLVEDGYLKSTFLLYKDLVEDYLCRSLQKHGI